MHVGQLRLAMERIEVKVVFVAGRYHMGVAGTRLYYVDIYLGGSSSLLRKWPPMHKYRGH